MKDSKLSRTALPCPRCGGKAVNHQTKAKEYYFACETKGCACGGVGKTPKEALERWNDKLWRVTLKPIKKGKKAPTVEAAEQPRAVKRAPKQAELPLPDRNRRGREKAPVAALPPPSKAKGKAVAAGAVQPTRGGCGARIRELLKKGVADSKILELIHKEFPWSKATQSDVNWNRRKLRNEEGVEV